MLTIILIAFAIGFLAFLYNLIEYDLSSAIILGAIFAGFGIFPGLIVATELHQSADRTWVEDSRTEIITLADVSGTSGTIRSGMFSTTAVFRQSNAFNYYYRDGDGFILTNRDAGTSKVFLDSETPYVVDLCYAAEPSIWTIGERCSEYRSEFHIPPGSLSESIELDGK